MVVYMIRCANCEKVRIGRERNQEVEPYRDECPDCGENDYTVPAKE